ncbi:hypothetical protein [Streptomyces griseocarneus]|uniref:hypothetical protein n=1 Tax=Streptomyces griseocarneus TaxID=51201 RepID=UPI00167E9906|nr:hypothetical protein [Streptomyces griseocarneus]MBZ6475100.1 hypothetical protein [Streptomyces griseocarneus]GHG62248.1 hypothetical protein GCM10018779_30800 [Streptomyces griseocarneus]
MRIPDAKVVAGLAAAGLLFREVVPITDELIPVSAASGMGYLGQEEGRAGVLIRHDEADLCARINEEWERLALERGLFTDGTDGTDGGREFLVGLDISGSDPNEAEPEQIACRWVRVEIAPTWDVAGAGCASSVLGAGAGNPAFIMASLDGDVLMHSGYYQVGIGLSVVTRPGNIPGLREEARRRASSGYLESAQRHWVERWLAALPRDAAKSDA